MSDPAPRRAPWQYALCAVFTAAAAADASLLGSWLLDRTTEPAGIVAWHVVTMATAITSLVAIWRRRGWAPYAVAAWGVANTTLVLAVPFLVTVDPDGVRGIWLGAGVVGVLATVCVWVVHRMLKRP